MAIDVIQNIKDYFVKNSQEYKTFINEFKKSSPEEFYTDGERKFSKNEQKFLRLFEKDQGKKTVIHSSPADFQINNKQDIIIKEIEKIKVIPLNEIELRKENEEIKESTKVKIIPATEEFKLDEDMYYELSPTHYYQKEQEADNEMWGKIYEAEAKNNIIADTEEYKIAVSALSLEYPEILNKIEKGGEEDQLIIDFQDKFIDTLQKLGMSNYENAIYSHYDDVVSDRFNVLKVVEKNIVPMLDVYLVNKEGLNYFKAVEQPLKVGDRINLLTKSGDLYAKGQVKFIEKEGIVLNTSNGIVKAPLDARIEPLFLLDTNNSKKNIEFGVNETISLLTKKELPLHENYFGDRMKDFTDLLKGNKTSLLPFNKEENKFHGKLQIVTNREGKPIVNLDLKVNDLKSNLIQHSFLSEAQKNQILKTGELGLVDIKNENEKMWVSVDKDLNKLVFKNEKEIRIDGIYGVRTTELEKNKLKSGEGTLMEILGENYFVIASAAAKSRDGLRIFTEERAKELKLAPEENQEKTNDKTKSISFK